jgi:hypothetical protein
MLGKAAASALRVALPARRFGSAFTTPDPQSRLDELRQALAKEEGAKQTAPAGSETAATATAAVVPRGTFAIETYGCQMNVSDSEIVRAILLTDGWFEVPPLPKDQSLVRRMDQAGTPIEPPDLTLINTCAIRDNAENKIWERLNTLNGLRKDRLLGGSRRASAVTPLLKPRNSAPQGTSEAARKGPALVGVLGCMAERLKERLLEDAPGGVVDLVVRLYAL